MSTDRASGHFFCTARFFSGDIGGADCVSSPSSSFDVRAGTPLETALPTSSFPSATQSTRRETSQENQTARQDRAPTHQTEQVAHRFKPNDASKPGPEPATCRSFDCLWRSLHDAAVHAAIRHSPSRSSEPVASLLKNGPLDSSNVVPHSNVRQGVKPETNHATATRQAASTHWPHAHVIKSPQPPSHGNHFAISIGFSCL